MLAVIIFTVLAQLCLLGSYSRAINSNVVFHDMYQTLRSKENTSVAIRYHDIHVCNGQVPSHTGWATNSIWNIAGYQESSSEDVVNAPVILWSSGCSCQSSLLGAMLETGTCLVSDDGRSTRLNTFTWARKAHMIYLDESVNVGFSYADGGYAENNKTERLDIVASEMIQAIQLLYLAFPHLTGRDLHLAGESFAGRVLPFVAKNILEHNAHANASEVIPIKSVLIGNGIIDSSSQLPATRDTVCMASPGLPALFNSTDCNTRLASQATDCAVRQQACLASSDAEGSECSEAARACDEGILSSALYGRHDPTNRSPHCFQDGKSRRPADCGTSRLLALHSLFANHDGDKLLVGQEAALQHPYQGLVVTPSVPLIRETGSGLNDIQTLLEHEIGVLLYYGALDILASPLHAERALDHGLTGERGREWRASVGRDGGEFGLNLKGSVRATSAASGSASLWFVVVDDVGRLVPSQAQSGALDLLHSWLGHFGKRKGALQQNVVSEL